MSENGNAKPLVRITRFDGQSSYVNPEKVEKVYSYGEEVKTCVELTGCNVDTTEPLESVVDRLGFRLVDHVDDPAKAEAKVVEVDLADYLDPPTFNPNAVVIPEEPETSPVPLAVGQVWRDRSRSRAKIESIDYVLGTPQANIIYLDRPGSDRIREDIFRDLYPTLVSPAPPSRDDLIAALVSDKRLRYERDPASDYRGPWGEVVVKADKDSAHTYRGCVWSYEKPYTSAILTEAHFQRGGAADFAIGLAESLGYRFVEVLGV